ncbi:protein-disulfide reductase DsbD family protein [Desertivirga xinjiangensis]|uniref:protein-disulfide reductase DsbD family protein n=1 Tax=Desertivirga xinjiangensis TaxID=539206 RepID=UPI00210F0EDB|nr:thioredoxin family protein [Pedobacter xinjiangensis]
MRKICFCVTLIILNFCALAQISEPVKWSFAAKELGNGQVDLLLTAVIEPGWHVYSQFIDEGGPIPTSFKFTPSKDYVLVGKTAESPKAVSAFDKAFNMEIAWHEKKVVFKQRIKLSTVSTVVSGTLEFMVCDDSRCLPPEEVSFKIPVKIEAGATAKTSGSLPNTIKEPEQKQATADTPLSEAVKASPADTLVPAYAKGFESDRVELSMPAASKAKDNTLLGIFLAGFAGGLLAFFMPCIYPMIPLTVSFFTKRSGSRQKGIRSAVIYGLSIVIVYVFLGVVVTAVFGASALNDLASSAFFNLFFFVVIVLFALSFLGAFEITLPASLVNKADEKSNQGGLMGLFFMAFTLALVSFSCTGPIIGYLLVETVSNGVTLGPAVGMLGFSIALAIPFTLFAIFPSWLKELPKSGGWMNSVKVSLGFLELALAFKFLSNVDLAYHWGILNRDVFLVIWIVIFGIWAMYLLGKIRLSHDSPIEFISLTRLFFAMVVLGFAIYIVPGLWGAPLKALSGWLPPPGTQEFNLHSGRTDHALTPKKYQGLFEAPHGLDVFYDYEEGLNFASKQNKPVLLDFTGHSCANCRRMEQGVWSDPEVLKILKNDYVLISLYVDDRTELPQNEKLTSESGKEIKTLGQKWSDLQTRKFKTNSQPYYVIVNTAGETLVPPRAFDLDIDNYIEFLNSGKAAFSTKK